LENVHASGQSWTAIANVLGVGKQTLTGFQMRRAPALDAEAVLRLCTTLKLSLSFENQTIRSVLEETQIQAEPVLRLEMEFDDSFELRSDPTPRAILTRKPPNRASYIGVRIERVGGGSGPSSV
jgi:hypothetical protein